MTTPHPSLVLTEEVRSALGEHRAVVALESTIISHGMPHPQNIEMAVEVERIVRSHGAVPATIAVLHGRPHVGLTPADLDLLATSPDVAKVSVRDLAFVMAQGRHGATTVASTMRLAELAGIAVFVTGGIGGVHRGASTTFDISADLTELARSKVAVVSAGVKSILDIGLTLETMETLGVPVITVGSEEFPAFYSRRSGFASPMHVNAVDEVAAIMQAHWGVVGGGGLSIANPVPEAEEIPTERIDGIIARALEEMAAAGISGKDATPYLLGRIVTLTGGDSLRANVALVNNNAHLGGRLAVAYAGLVAKG